MCLSVYFDVSASSWPMFDEGSLKVQLKLMEELLQGEKEKSQNIIEVTGTIERVQRETEDTRIRRKWWKIMSCVLPKDYIDLCLSQSHVTFIWISAKGDWQAH